MKRIVSILLLAFLCRSFLYAAVEEKAITKRLDEELASQGKKMAENRSNWCQSGDMNRSLKIKEDVTLYFTESYVMRAFLCQRMFKTFTTFYRFHKSLIVPAL